MGFLASLGPSEAFLKISWDSFGILVGFLASLGPSWIPKDLKDYPRLNGILWGILLESSD